MPNRFIDSILLAIIVDRARTGRDGVIVDQAPFLRTWRAHTFGDGAEDVSVIAPDGRLVRQVSMADPVTTNICFGGPDLRMAHVTLSGTGQLVALDWPEPGLRLAYEA